MAGGVAVGRRRRKSRHAHRCRNCGHQGIKWFRRGLCSACYYDPDIRRRYGPVGSFADDYLTGQDFYGPAAPCPGALPGAPGSAERQLALALRADSRAELFPPGCRAGWEWGALEGLGRLIACLRRRGGPAGPGGPGN